MFDRKPVNENEGLLEILEDILEDLELARIINKRRGEKEIPVNIDDL